MVDASTPTKRRSQGGDSKYGFSPSGNGQTPMSPRGNNGSGYPYNSPSSRQLPPPVNSTNLDFINGQPHPTTTTNQQRSNGYPGSGQPHYNSSYSQYNGSNGSSSHTNGNGAELPPKIDRSSKPSSRLPRSAQERLFGSREGDVNGLGMDSYPTSPPGPAPTQQNGHDNYIGSLRGSSLDRERLAKAVLFKYNIIFKVILIFLIISIGEL